MVISTVLVSSPNEPDYNGALFLTALPGLLRHCDGYISCCSKSSYQPNFFSITSHSLHVVICYQHNMISLFGVLKLGTEGQVHEILKYILDRIKICYTFLFRLTKTNSLKNFLLTLRYC